MCASARACESVRASRRGGRAPALHRDPPVSPSGRGRAARRAELVRRTAPPAPFKQSPSRLRLISHVTFTFCLPERVARGRRCSGGHTSAAQPAAGAALPNFGHRSCGRRRRPRGATLPAGVRGWGGGHPLGPGVVVGSGDRGRQHAQSVPGALGPAHGGAGEADGVPFAPQRERGRPWPAAPERARPRGAGRRMAAGRG